MSVFAEHEKFVWHWKELLHHCKKKFNISKDWKKINFKKMVSNFLYIYAMYNVYNIIQNQIFIEDVKNMQCLEKKFDVVMLKSHNFLLLIV